MKSDCRSPVNVWLAMIGSVAHTTSSALTLIGCVSETSVTSDVNINTGWEACVEQQVYRFFLVFY